MNCKNCGAPLDEGALFCRKCGTSVDETREPSPFSDLKPKKKRFASQRATQEKAPSPFLDLKPDKKKGDVLRDADPFPTQETSPESEHVTPPRPHSEPKSEPEPDKAPKRIRERKAPGKRKLPELPKFGKLPKKSRTALLIGVAALVLIVLTVVIVSAVSCGKKERFDSPEALKDAVVEALERGDGGRLAALAKISAPFFGRHPETFGEGETPEAVMRGYYDRTANEFRAKLTERFGPGCSPKADTDTWILSGSEIFETNRALGLEAPQYAEMTGPLTVNGEAVASLRIVGAELDGAWVLIAVYVY